MTVDKKLLVVCLDGTSDAIGLSLPTNPAKVFQMLDLDDPLTQMAYYDPGVGTLPSSTARGRLGHWVSRMGQAAVGWGLKANVAQAYTWLMRNYRPGDDIFIFGFSRGAFTARALAGMLHRPGLLRSGSDNLVDYAVHEYARKKTMGDAHSERLSDFSDSLCWGTLTHPLNPDAPADWLPVDRRHSVPVTYLGVWDTVEAIGLGRFGSPEWPGVGELANVREGRHAVAIDERRPSFAPTLVDGSRRVQEAWFGGVHSDVGGTYTDCELATIALKWVFGPAVGLGLELKGGARIEPDLCTVKESFAGADAHKHGGLWRVLPSRRRVIPKHPLVHASVRVRLENDPDYLRRRGVVGARFTDDGWLGWP